MRHGPMVGAHGEWTSLLTKPLLAKTDAPSAAVPMAMGPWVVTYGELTPLFIKAVELSFGRNRCPLGHSAYGHGPMGGSPIYGHGPMGVTYLWPWAHGRATCLWPWPHGGHLPMAMGPWVLDPVLLKSVELSFDQNRCPLGHSAYGHGPMGGHLWPQAHGTSLFPWAPGGSPMGK